MRRIKKGNEVIVISGNDKGKRGVVLNVIGNKLIVEGVNAAKKHVKANPQKNQQGGIILHFLPIHASNVALYDHSSGKGSKVGVRFLDDGKKARYFKKSGELVEI